MIFDWLMSKGGLEILACIIHRLLLPYVSLHEVQQLRNVLYSGLLMYPL